jgi:hypothetical protein
MDYSADSFRQRQDHSPVQAVLLPFSSATHEKWMIYD